MSYEIRTSGPLFDGSAASIFRDMADDLGQTVAHRGVGVVRTEFAKVVKHPTGRYSSSVQRESQGSRHKIHDGGMIYGPWLDGSGERNKTTRFKGYAHWRRATQVLERSIPAVAREVLPRHLRRLQ